MIDFASTPTRSSLALLASLFAASCAVSDTGRATSNTRATSSANASAAPLPTWSAPALDGAPTGSAVVAESATPLEADAGPPPLVPNDAGPPSDADAVDEKPVCPPHMALIGRYCIDQFEDALEQSSADGTWSAHPYYERPPKDALFRAVSAPGQFPQGYISRVESKAACEASGKRLCTKGEWQHACRGKGFQTYPYGERGVHDKCNAGKIHLLSQMFPHPVGGMKYDEHFNSPELNKTAGFLAKSGEYAGCTTELGVSDMIGNLHEWVSDTVTQDLMDKLDEENVERRKQPWREGNGVFMGGFYSTTSEHGPGCFFITVAHEPAYHDYSTGFRCCEDANLPKKTTPKPPGKKPSPPKPASSH
jgi:hypothetical protein